MNYDYRSLLLVSAVVRVCLIIYGEWQDSHMEVRYTDLDYLVFSDASSLMATGMSPYKRSTYRYSPLLAFMLLPNSFIHASWGKLLFSASDLLVGLFIRIILKLRGVPENLCLISMGVWLFNPFTFTIGTRGNCKVLQAAFWYGLVVHFRIYPIIYALPILLVLKPHNIQSGSKPYLQNWTPSQQKSQQSSSGEGLVRISDSWLLLRSMLTGEKILFGLLSGSVFFFWTGLFFYLYQWEFLNEALLYHLTRTDPRHNFSIYFYHIYLHHQHEFSILEKLVTFLPQLMVQLVLIFRFAQDLPFCYLVQTVAFVAFNKVITAQYFVWYFCLLPLVLPWSTITLRWEGISCILIWMGAQIHWLMWGYLLEFKGKNVFVQLWFAGLLFLAANTWVLVVLIRRHKFSPVFLWSEKTSSKSGRKLQ
ncbi:hypothetical protein IFM89_015094 [Coptis chinensis]|uniref:GPI mannosyltransferase 1 n=1 Tax=Coptis chinensis TaxID=261450 RepID=A0A835IQ62_9MAGN|nr:hypothetical protein IFM89_015094 [Coptis chinensis]